MVFRAFFFACGVFDTTCYMQGSKSVQKRKLESAEEVAASKAAQAARKERRRCGHVPVLPRGQDAARDALEKGYAIVATKCGFGYFLDLGLCAHNRSCHLPLLSSTTTDVSF
jgi:hypothetical protein